MQLQSSERPEARVEEQLALGFEPVPQSHRQAGFQAQVRTFQEFGQTTQELMTSIVTAEGERHEIPTYVNEFWTARQRQASSLHEVSYRACFKPQLPRFFIERLTRPGERVYDPFMGRGTTLIEAALLGRVPIGNDANPLSVTLTRPRLHPPTLQEVEARLHKIPLNRPGDCPADLLVFFHPETLTAISSLKRYFTERREAGTLDSVDEWLCLVALNRLTGHSAGFFSVYSLPPNQAVSVKSQRKINEKRNQVPPARDVVRIILKKSRLLLSDVDPAARKQLATAAKQSVLLTGDAAETAAIANDSVALVVTSPPFLDVVQYSTDNWLRCWFLGIDAGKVKLTVPSKLTAWAEAMNRVFAELARVVRPGGHVAFEVGEVHSGKTRLEDTVLGCGLRAGLKPLLVLINDQEFTKTSNCWGISNMDKGTNTNRIVVFQKKK